MVLGAVLGGFMMAGGHMGALIQISEYVVICGSAAGALVIMSPKSVIIALFKQMFGTLKGSPYSRKAYEDMFKALYELFMLGRRNGMIALEEHVLTPESSSIFTKYPGLVKDHHAMGILCGGLKPIILCGPADDPTPFQQFQVVRNAPLSEVKSILANAALFIGNDSGPAHMACALGVPQVVLFGPSDPRIWAPWKPIAAGTLTASSMSDISVSQVEQALEQLKVPA